MRVLGLLTLLPPLPHRLPLPSPFTSQLRINFQFGIGRSMFPCAHISRRAPKPESFKPLVANRTHVSNMGQTRALNDAAERFSAICKCCAYLTHRRSATSKIRLTRARSRRLRCVRPREASRLVNSTVRWGSVRPLEFSVSFPMLAMRAGKIGVSIHLEPVSKPNGVI